MPDLRRIMPAAPTADDPRDVSDRTIFRNTRALEGSPRWQMAARDDNVSMRGLMTAFSCAVGVELTNENAPRTIALVNRAFADTNRAIGPLKNLFQRKRPFLVDEGAICVPRSASLVGSFDYPSGHSTAGWAAGLILSAVVPERSTEILFRARAFGESRVICGVHNATAVEAGRFGATAVFASLIGSGSFQTDLMAAQTEVRALRSEGSAPAPSCTDEASALATRPY